MEEGGLTAGLSEMTGTRQMTVQGEAMKETPSLCVAGVPARTQPMHG
jgi:hypothetical protein